MTKPTFTIKMTCSKCEHTWEPKGWDFMVSESGCGCCCGIVEIIVDCPKCHKEHMIKAA